MGEVQPCRWYMWYKYLWDYKSVTVGCQGFFQLFPKGGGGDKMRWYGLLGGQVCIHVQSMWQTREVWGARGGGPASLWKKPWLPRLRIRDRNCHCVATWHQQQATVHRDGRARVRACDSNRSQQSGQNYCKNRTLVMCMLSNFNKIAYFYVACALRVTMLSTGGNSDWFQILVTHCYSSRPLLCGLATSSGSCRGWSSSFQQ